MQPMVANTKQDFANRLNKACSANRNGIPEGRGQVAELRRRIGKSGLNVSGEAVRKWLSAESIPTMDSIRYIAATLRVSANWLLTGQGEMDIIDSIKQQPTVVANEPRSHHGLTTEESQLLDLFRDIPSNEQSALISLLKARSESIHPAAEIAAPETKFKIERPNDLIKSHLGANQTQTINTSQGAE